MKKIILLFFSALVAALLIFGLTEPINDRDYNDLQAIQAQASIEGDLIHIQNIRNASYFNTTTYNISYYNHTFNISTLERAWFLVEPFSDIEGIAHTMLQYHFSDNTTITTSVEVRKEEGEDFGIIGGLTRQFELYYVIAPPEDTVYLRTHIRKNRVYKYPINSTPEKLQALFVQQMQHNNKLADKPEFYHLLWRSCTTTIYNDVNEVFPGALPRHWKLWTPGYSDEYLYDLGLIDTELEWEDVREEYLVRS